jgi:hypothetical protein
MFRPADSLVAVEGLLVLAQDGSEEVVDGIELAGGEE